MDEEHSFIQAIRDNPADEATRLVYADWLEERDDPRGKFLRLESEFTTLSKDSSPSVSRRKRSRKERIQTRLQKLRPGISAEWLALVDRHFAETVTSEIIKARWCGQTTCIVRDVDSVVSENSFNIRQILDSCVEQLGFRGLGEAWGEISAQEAKVIAQAVLNKDLAYNSEIMDEDRAAFLAEWFLSVIGKSARFFTNGTLGQHTADPQAVTGGWIPITPATFDTGVICVKANRVSILWVQDED
jgi:uncharacterized protein (TIGR02996 family)